MIEENRVSKLQIRVLGLFAAGALKSGSTRKSFRNVKRKIRRKLKNDRKKAVMLKAEVSLIKKWIINIKKKYLLLGEDFYRDQY